MGYYKKSLMLWDTANPRPLCLANRGVVDMEKWPRICSNSKYNKGQGHLGQVHSKKVAPIEPKMAPAVTKREITHILKISVQSEQLCESFTLNAMLGYCRKSLMLWDTANPRPLCLPNRGVVCMEKWPRICSNSKYNKGHGHLGQVHSRKVAPIELKMAQQSWRAKSRTYTKFQPNRSNYNRDMTVFTGFLKKRKSGTRAQSAKIWFQG